MTSTARAPVHQEQKSNRDQADSPGREPGHNPDSLLKTATLLLPGSPVIHCLISFSITALCGLVIYDTDHRVFIVGLCAYGLAWFILFLAKFAEGFLHLDGFSLLGGPALTALLYFLLQHSLPDSHLHPLACFLVCGTGFALALPDFVSGFRLIEGGVEKALFVALTALEKTRYAQWARKTKKNVYEGDQQKRKFHQTFL